MKEQSYPPLSPFLVALKCRCPRCGEAKLYAGLLTVVDICGHCGLDMQAQDSADGPAAFGILIVGALAVSLMAFLEFSFKPPIWVHLAVQLPVLVGASMLSLRFFKALLIALQFRNRIGGFEQD